MASGHPTTPTAPALVPSKPPCFSSCFSCLALCLFCLPSQLGTEHSTNTARLHGQALHVSFIFIFASFIFHLSYFARAQIRNAQCDTHHLLFSSFSPFLAHRTQSNCSLSSSFAILIRLSSFLFSTHATHIPVLAHAILVSLS